MKANEFSHCLFCGKGVAHAGAPVFLRARVEYFCMRPAAIRRAVGLEMALGPLAAIMGPDEELAEKISEGVGLICAGCMIDMAPPFAILEAATNQTAVLEANHG